MPIRPVVVGSLLPLTLLLLPTFALAQGVSNDTIVLGQPAVFSGPSAGLGVELWRGTNARLRETNDGGGIHGRQLSLRVCDDKYDPELSARCAIDLITKQHVFLLTNTVGTPTIVRLLPLLQVWARDTVLVFGNFTGAKPQRSFPAAQFVFNIRASYEQETATHVKACSEAGRHRIGTFVQNDAFGKDGEEGVRLATKSAGAVLAASTSYERGTAATADMSAHVRILREANVDCISTTGSYQGVAAFVKAVRAAQWSVPIFAVLRSSVTIAQR